MNISFSITKQIKSLLHIPTTTITPFYRPQRDKVVIVLGATGTGKSRLSIDLATYFPAEIINSDKIQVYKGLDIATNKITDEEQRGIPHHLLGAVDQTEADFSASHFRVAASRSIQSILDRDRLPIIAGGSNSFIEALIDSNFRRKFDCCFLWIDVSMPILHSFVSDRVDRMVERGLIDEVREYYRPNGDYSRGIRRAIGVPEFDHYFRVESSFSQHEDSTREKFLREAIERVKENTIKLALRQLEKIHRLRNVKGWRLHRIDATEVFMRRLGGGEEAEQEAWESLVKTRSAAILSKFLYDPSFYDDRVTAARGRVPTMVATALY